MGYSIDSPSVATRTISSKETMNQRPTCPPVLRQKERGGQDPNASTGLCYASYGKHHLFHDEEEDTIQTTRTTNRSTTKAGKLI